LLLQLLTGSPHFMRVERAALHLHDSRTAEKGRMLKITITNTAKEELWTLQGRLVAPWVKELRASWKRAHLPNQTRRCIVSLYDVTFIDSSGERMLRCMRNQGAQLVASDVYVKQVLDRLRGKSR
jgi:anti-anti-sigma regulatory factor